MWGSTFHIYVFPRLTVTRDHAKRYSSHRSRSVAGREMFSPIFQLFPASNKRKDRWCAISNPNPKGLISLQMYFVLVAMDIG
jgi:hypothetical protein